jgi:1-acyl-sn-glycerol-3-phosphate acyltransferase
MSFSEKSVTTASSRPLVSKIVKKTESHQEWWGRLLYDSLWFLSRTFSVSLFGFRFKVMERLPESGGVLVLSSHQSHLDPLLLGLATNRRLSSLARSSLFKFGPFGNAIAALGAVPIDRTASSVTAMRTVIQRLRKGAAVIVFPEGTRTSTGQLGEMKKGFALLAKRAAVPIAPVAIVGAYECWPRFHMFPRPGRIRLHFGTVITADEVKSLSETQLADRCLAVLQDLDKKARSTRQGHVPE